MRRLAAAGRTVVVEAGGETYEFKIRRRSRGVLGCMAGRAQLDQLRPGPAIPPEEWGPLAS